MADAGAYFDDSWQVSGLTQDTSGLIPLPTTSGGSAVYGGTPSDQSIVRCIRDLKARGLRVMFYPFLLMTCAGYPWRGRITFAPDLSEAATNAANAFLGSAPPDAFIPDPINLTVGYTGSPTDYTYRRMILHYAWLCTIAGGVDLFLIGSELRGLETLRGATWTPAGTTDESGCALWDYPFVSGLLTLASDVRAVFDGQGFTRAAASPRNLIAYSADWSDWMGYQHPGANGQWPHLDTLWASPNIDIVGLDNYLPLSDWTTGDGGFDARNWLQPEPSEAWPPSPTSMSGLGLSGPPTIYSLAYLKKNIEGGEKFYWWYGDGDNEGPGLDPNGSDLIVSLPIGDRLAQSRSPYYPNQEILANKQYRWWWKNTHRAVYDTGDGLGWIPRGPHTQWIAQSKPIAFIEYGYPATDRGANQPNVFFDAKSTESATPYWSIWSRIAGGGLAPLRDDTIASLCLQAMYEYWNVDGRNEASPAGVPLIDFDYSCVWNWDARPFPVFPLLASEWGDAGNWATGDWINGHGPQLAPSTPSAGPAFGAFPTFPALTVPVSINSHVAALRRRCREHRGRPLAAAHPHDVAALRLRTEFRCVAVRLCHMRRHRRSRGSLRTSSGSAAPFWFAPPNLSAAYGQILGAGDGSTFVFPLRLTIGSALTPIGGTTGITAAYLDGQSGDGLDAKSGLSARSHICRGAADGRHRLRGLHRALALPVRRRWTRSRGIHGHALRARYRKTNSGASMSTPPSFPSLAGQGWSVHKKPIFSTIVASHISGREVRDALYQNPIWEFEVTFDGLGSDSITYPGVGAQSLQAIMGLYLQCLGQYGTFLYTDPTDSLRHEPGDCDRRRSDIDLHLRPYPRRLPGTRGMGDECVRSHHCGCGAGVWLVAHRRRMRSRLVHHRRAASC